MKKILVVVMILMMVFTTTGCGFVDAVKEGVTEGRKFENFYPVYEDKVEKYFRKTGLLTDEDDNYLFTGFIDLGDGLYEIDHAYGMWSDNTSTYVTISVYYDENTGKSIHSDPVHEVYEETFEEFIDIRDSLV